VASGGTVIDALVVTLGLESSAFKSGIEGATASLTGFATKVAGLALGFKGLEAGIQYFENLHQKLSDLYFTGRNLGILGTELSRLGELAKLFGGNMTDAASSVNNLQSAVFNLRFKGQMSESLLMLQRFGVQYLTAQGHMRDPEQIARDAAVAIERQAQAAGLNSGERFQLAQSFGLQGGLASAAAAGPAEFDQELARARKDQAGLTQGTLRGQAMLGRDITSRQTQRDVLNSQVLNALIPAIEKVNEILQDIARKGIPLAVQGINFATDFFEHPPKWFLTFEQGLRDLGEKLGPTGSLIAGIAGLTAAIGVGSVATSLLAKTTTLSLRGILPVGLGIALGAAIDELDEKLGGKLGVTKFGDWLGGKLPGSGDDYDPNRIAWKSSMLKHAVPVTPTATRPNVGVEPPISKNTGGTNITFENVTVNSRSQDGAGLARDFTSSVRRSLNAAGADSGQN
jgi:hypothetical protein